MLSLYAIFCKKKKNDIFVHYWGVPSTSYRKHVSDKNLHFLIHIKYLKAEKKKVLHILMANRISTSFAYLLNVSLHKKYTLFWLLKRETSQILTGFSTVLDFLIKVLAMNILHHNAEHRMLKRNWLQHQTPPLYQTKMKTQLVFMF